MTFSISALSVCTGGVIGMLWICCWVTLNSLSYSEMCYNQYWLDALASPLAQFQDNLMCSVAAFEINQTKICQTQSPKAH